MKLQLCANLAKMVGQKKKEGYLIVRLAVPKVNREILQGKNNLIWILFCYNVQAKNVQKKTKICRLTDC